MRKKTLLIVILTVVACSLGAALVYQMRTAEKRAVVDSNDPYPANVQKDIQKRVEGQFRQKQYAPMIALYKRMLEKYPDSLDLKKKLGMAYFGANEYDKARPFLEEVEKGGAADDEVRRELEYIRKGNK